MSNYNEGTITGSKWTRCSSIHIINKYGKIPHIIFGEEDLVDIGEPDPIIKNKGSEIHADFDQLNGIIPILDPSTGLPTGATVSHVELYTILYSLYMQKAVERDTYINSQSIE